MEETTAAMAMMMDFFMMVSCVLFFESRYAGRDGPETILGPPDI
jgi:hypothetical protein